MKGNDRKLALMHGICRMYLDLGELCNAVRSDEVALGRMLQDGRISQFRYDLEMEHSRRNFDRIANLLKRLDAHYESVKRIPDGSSIL